MNPIRARLLGAGSVLLLVSITFASADTSKRPTATSSAKHATKTHPRKARKSRKASWRRGQQKIDPKRARDIQEALIREHYLEGTPSGVWNESSQKAMERYQADNGWQTKVIPDSRALIKLGLGPGHEHLLNPESAMTTVPAPRAEAAQANAPQKQ